MKTKSIFLMAALASSFLALLTNSTSLIAGNLSCHNKDSSFNVDVNFDSHTITTTRSTIGTPVTTPHSTISTTLRMRELHDDNDDQMNILAVSETYINKNGISSAESFCYHKKDRQYFIVLSNTATDETLDMQMLSCKQIAS